MNLQQLGVTVRERRIELGLNQSQIAAMSGLSRTTVNLLENGSISDIGFAKIDNLLSVLGIQLQTLNVGQKKNNNIAPNFGTNVQGSWSSTNGDPAGFLSGRLRALPGATGRPLVESQKGTKKL